MGNESSSQEGGSQRRMCSGWFSADDARAEGQEKNEPAPAETNGAKRVIYSDHDEEDDEDDDDDEEANNDEQGHEEDRDEDNSDSDEFQQRRPRHVFKSTEVRARLRQALGAQRSLQPLLAQTTGAELKQLIDALAPVAAPHGDRAVLYKQGDRANELYLIVQGSAEAIAPDGNVLSPPYLNGELLGAFELMHHMKTRVHGAVSTWGGADTELWSLDRGSFRLILGRGVDRALALEQEFCSDHKLFKGLERYPFALHFATRMAQTIAFAEGETIINEGSTSTRLFSLRSGTAKIVKVVNGRECEAEYYRAGDWFGELCYLLPQGNNPRAAARRAASIVATSPCVCVSIDPAHYRSLPALGIVRFDRAKLLKLYETMDAALLKPVYPLSDEEEVEDEEESKHDHADYATDEDVYHQSRDTPTASASASPVASPTQYNSSNNTAELMEEIEELPTGDANGDNDADALRSTLDSVIHDSAEAAGIEMPQQLKLLGSLHGKSEPVLGYFNVQREMADPSALKVTRAREELQLWMSSDAEDTARNGVKGALNWCRRGTNKEKDDEGQCSIKLGEITHIVTGQAPEEATSYRPGPDESEVSPALCLSFLVGPDAESPPLHIQCENTKQMLTIAQGVATLLGRTFTVFKEEAPSQHGEHRFVATSSPP